MSLSNYRNKINDIDKRLVKLLNDRAKLSAEIGKLKKKTKSGIYAPAREMEVLKRLESLNKGPLTAEAFEAIYREIMSSSLALEKITSIAYLGTEGSFTHMAANKKFGSQVNYYSCSSISEIFQIVERGECDYGVVPIENSVEGAVTHTFDLLVDYDLNICAQVMLKVSHNLLGKSNIKDIKVLYSNPQVFGQCRHWLSQNMPDAGQIWVASTTEAAQKVVKQKHAGALASSMAAQVYGLPILKANIQDISHNMTRFLVIAKQDVPPTGNDRTSIVFSIKDKVGALYSMLKPFYESKINLTKIESRPSKKRAWDYYFFVDFEGHRSDKNIGKALAKLETMCKFLKVVGSYPVKQ